jgi:hypothetical protein
VKLGPRGRFYPILFLDFENGKASATVLSSCTVHPHSSNQLTRHAHAILFRTLCAKHPGGGTRAVSQQIPGLVERASV